LLFSSADYFTGIIVPANLFADRINARKKIFDQIISDHADGRSTAHVRFRHVTPGEQIDIVELRHLGRPGAEVGVLQRVHAALGFHPAAKRSTNFLAGLAKLAHCFVVIVGDLLAFLEFEPFVDVGNDGRLARQTENIGPQAEHARGDILIRAVDQADDGDDRRHSDDYADQREHAAEFVRP
jgi:hypothetical protein